MINTNRQAFLQARAVAIQQQRALAGQKFRAAYRSAGFSRASAAKFLHVCERTLHNWESGRRPVPFAAMKLMRIWARYELPGHAWNGWCLHSGKLWTPDGYGFNPHDSTWWSLLCRRAAMFSQLYQENNRLRSEATARAAGDRGGLPQGAPAAWAAAAKPLAHCAAPLDAAGAAGQAKGAACNVPPQQGPDSSPCPPVLTVGESPLIGVHWHQLAPYGTNWHQCSFAGQAGERP